MRARVVLCTLSLVQTDRKEMANMRVKKRIDTVVSRNPLRYILGQSPRSKPARTRKGKEMERERKEAQDQQEGKKHTA